MSQLSFDKLIYLSSFLLLLYEIIQPFLYFIFIQIAFFYQPINFNSYFINISNILHSHINFQVFVYSHKLINMQKYITFGGDNPQARFGHTITPIGKERAILFGGAVGDSTKTSDKYVITGDTFLCDYIQKKFKKLQPRGTYPANRAAHAAVCVDQYLFVFGGALGGGELADDSLYQLQILTLTDKAFWSVRPCNGTSPGPRYGHVMGYLRPYLIIHGGNTGNQPIGDVWVNDILGTTQWKKVDTGVQNPPPRAYHSASICKTGTANGMMVIFGGRGADGQPLNDTWGLRKHRDNRLDWMKAPYRNASSKPAERYQHRTLFIGTLLVVVGGRNNVVGESMNMDIYDTETSDWYKLSKVDRFRHISFLIEQSIYIHGGFGQQAPTIPTDSILEINLNKIFADHPNLFKGLAYELGRDIITHNIPQGGRRNSIEHGNSKNLTLQSSQRRHDMNIEIENQKPKRQIYSNQKQIRLCPQALVANFNEENDLKKISIDDLPAEHRKLNNQTIHSFSKDSSVEAICRFFQNSLYCKSVAQFSYPIPVQYLDKMVLKLDKIFQQQPTLLRIRAPVKIFGDLHGQINDLNRLFEAFGSPDDGAKGDIESTNYLFLGDFIDRGSKSLQTLLLLLSLKLKYPQNVFLLRGGHQDIKINRSMGFGDECELKLKENIDDPRSFFQKVNKLFEKMPLAAIINDFILCLHGGIGSTLSNVNQIHMINKPIKVNHDPKTKNEKITYDILWSDPCRGREQNGAQNIDHDYFKTKANLKFSEKRAYNFCSENDLVTIIRSGEPVLQGYEGSQSLMTVFSCADYGGSGNKCAIIGIMKNQQVVPMVLHPMGGRDRWTELDRRKMNNEQQAHLRSLSFTPPK